MERFATGSHQRRVCFWCGGGDEFEIGGGPPPRPPKICIIMYSLTSIYIFLLLLQLFENFAASLFQHSRPSSRWVAGPAPKGLIINDLPIHAQSAPELQSVWPSSVATPSPLPRTLFNGQLSTRGKPPAMGVPFPDLPHIPRVDHTC